MRKGKAVALATTCPWRSLHIIRTQNTTMYPIAHQLPYTPARLKISQFPWHENVQRIIFIYINIPLVPFPSFFGGQNVERRFGPHHQCQYSALFRFPHCYPPFKYSLGSSSRALFCLRKKNKALFCILQHGSDWFTGKLDQSFILFHVQYRSHMPAAAEAVQILVQLQ